jgi:hypothetical protein
MARFNHPGCSMAASAAVISILLVLMLHLSWCGHRRKRKYQRFPVIKRLQ